MRVCWAQGQFGLHLQHHLEWQATPPIVPTMNRTKDVTVWIKPGVFVVKKVLVAQGNSFVV